MAIQKVLYSLPSRWTAPGPLCNSMRLKKAIPLCRNLTDNGRLAPHSVAPCSQSMRQFSSATSSQLEGDRGHRMMPFEEYRKLKKSLKIRARIAGLPTAVVGMMASSFINVHFNPRMFEMAPEEVQPILGLDPIVFAALCGVGTGAMGFILGGAMFNTTWRVLARQKSKQLQERDDDFLQRIQKHRFSAFNRYEDDYYGDKVVTLSDYRQWVRQQQKKRKNAAKFAQREASETGTESAQTLETSTKS